MSRITVDKSLCIQDGACVEVCGAGALALDQDGYPAEVPESMCFLCGHCAAVCTCDALTHAELPDEPFLPAPKELPAPALIDGFLMSRRSVREFKDEPVGREVLEALLDVARRAPTAVNSQKLHWIVVEGKANVHALSAETVKGARSAGADSGVLEAVGRGVRHCSAWRSHCGCRLRSAGLRLEQGRFRNSTHLPRTGSRGPRPGRLLGWVFDAHRRHSRSPSQVACGA